MAFGILPILHVARLRRSVIATAAVSLASSFTAVTFVSRCPIPLLKRRWARLAVLDSAAEARSGSHGGAQRPIRRVGACRDDCRGRAAFGLDSAQVRCGPSFDVFSSLPFAPFRMPLANVLCSVIVTHGAPIEETVPFV